MIVIIEHLNDVISDMEAEMKRNKIMKQFKGISEDPGSIKLKYGKYQIDYGPKMELAYQLRKRTIKEENLENFQQKSTANCERKDY